MTSNTAPLDVKTVKWSRLRVKKSSVWSKWFQALSGLKFSKKSIDRYRIKFDISTKKYLYGFRKIKINRELRTVKCRRTGTFLTEPTYLDMVNLAAVFSKKFKEGFKFKKVLNEPDFEDVHRGRISKSLLEQLLRTFRSG